MYVCMCMCVCVCKYLCMHAWMYECVYVCVHVFMYVRMYACTHVCVCVTFMYACMIPSMLYEHSTCCCWNHSTSGDWGARAAGPPRSSYMSSAHTICMHAL